MLILWDDGLEELVQPWFHCWGIESTGRTSTQSWTHDVLFTIKWIRYLDYNTSRQTDAMPSGGCRKLDTHDYQLWSLAYFLWQYLHFMRCQYVAAVFRGCRSCGRSRPGWQMGPEDKLPDICRLVYFTQVQGIGQCCCVACNCMGPPKESVHLRTWTIGGRRRPWN